MEQGRPRELPTDAKRRSLYLTDEEYKRVRELVKQWRNYGFSPPAPQQPPQQEDEEILVKSTDGNDADEVHWHIKALTEEMKNDGYILTSCTPMVKTYDDGDQSMSALLTFKKSREAGKIPPKLKAKLMESFRRREIEDRSGD